MGDEMTGEMIGAGFVPPLPGLGMFRDGHSPGFSSAAADFTRGYFRFVPAGRYVAGCGSRLGIVVDLRGACEGQRREQSS
jgi:hypothetical protein